MAPELDSDDENVEYEDDNGHHYRLYLDELDTSTTAASNSSASLQGTFDSGITKYQKVGMMRKCAENSQLTDRAPSPAEILNLVCRHGIES